jgi:AcrR family transcriptional regulator
MSAATIDVPTRLVEVTARVLAEEGPSAVSARRITGEVGVSTMAIYTHFGGMDELYAAVWREAFRRFGAELERSPLTDDPVADWMVQGWGYRHFALSDPHLYQAMFGPGLVGVHQGAPEDSAAATAVFGSLLRRLQRCADAGRFEIPDLFTAGELVWAAVHGQMLIELSGYHTALGRDPERAMAECMHRLSTGLGDDPTATRRSLSAATQRARRRGLVSRPGAPVSASRPAS